MVEWLLYFMIAGHQLPLNAMLFQTKADCDSAARELSEAAARGANKATSHCEPVPVAHTGVDE